jgi:crotonobetainyl-CoA:carnitine CoA-transferase CaiB-like acyl-CoA transferase
MEKLLEGVKVIDFTLAAAGPGCTKILTEYGAENILIEPLSGTTSRTNAPHTFNFKCGGKKSVPIDLKTAEGMELMLKLVEWADVFVSNYRTKALAKLGLSYSKLSEVNPRLVYATITGYGNRGPKKDDPGFDTTCFWATSGMMLDIAQKGSITNAPIAIGDVAAGQGLAAGVCAGLFRREKTGRGCNITTSLLGEAAFLNFDAIIESQYGQEFPKSRTAPMRALLNTYQCGDGEWITLNAMHHWESSWPCICELIDRKDLLNVYHANEDTMYDRAPAVVAALDEGFKKFSRQQVVDALKTCGTIAVEEVRHSNELLADSQALANEMLVESSDVTQDGKRVMIPATPLKIGDETPVEYLPGPRLGEHTVEVMKMLGYSDETIKSYYDRRIVIAEMV